MPFDATVALAVVPSGKVTVTVEPGSPVPVAFNVPSGLAEVVRVGTAGGVVSV